MNSLAEFIQNSISKGMGNGELSNSDLVEIIELSGDYLNLATPSEYAEVNNISYQGAIKDSKTRKNIELFNVKFIIDNY